MGQFKKGQSGNKGGRPKVVEAFRAKARKAVDKHVLKAWTDEVEIKKRKRFTPMGIEVEYEGKGPEWMRASENLAAYGYGKPSPIADDGDKCACGGNGGEARPAAVFVVGTEKTYF